MQRFKSQGQAEPANQGELCAGKVNLTTPPITAPFLALAPKEQR